MDQLLKTIAKNRNIRAYAAVTTDLVNLSAQLHRTSPVATAALGRTLSAASMMGAMLKNEGESVSLQLKGDGPLGSVFAIGDSKARVRGYVNHPLVDLPLKNGKLDVGGAIGQDGTLCVVRDLQMGQPYVGQVPLATGEVGDDLTLYFARSEQLPSAVGLGVLVDVDYSVKAAGGFIISLMPGADEDTISLVERGLSSITSVTDLIVQGKGCEDILSMLLPGVVLEEMEIMTPSYHCGCSLEKMERGMISLGVEELEDIIQEQGEADLVCHFCNKHYHISRERLEELKSFAKSGKTK